MGFALVSNTSVEDLLNKYAVVLAVEAHASVVNPGWFISGSWLTLFYRDRVKVVQKLTASLPVSCQREDVCKQSCSVSVAEIIDVVLQTWQALLHHRILNGWKKTKLLSLKNHMGNIQLYSCVYFFFSESSKQYLNDWNIKGHFR